MVGCSTTRVFETDYWQFYPIQFYSQPTSVVMSSSKRISSKEDLPIQRVLRQREMIESLRHDNEILRLDLTHESRDSRRAASSGAAMDIARWEK